MRKCRENNKQVRVGSPSFQASPASHGPGQTRTFSWARVTVTHGELLGVRPTSRGCAPGPLCAQEPKESGHKGKATPASGTKARGAAPTLPSAAGAEAGAELGDEARAPGAARGAELKDEARGGGQLGEQS